MLKPIIGFLNRGLLKTLLHTSSLTVLLLIVSFDASAQISYDSYFSENQTELQRIDAAINSIRTKKAWILNNPTENSQADTSKWLSDMRNTLWQLFAEKRMIIREETTKEFFSIEEFSELSIEKQQVVIDGGNAIIEQ